MKFRAFIAVEVGAQPQLIDLADKLRATKADLKLVDPDNIHVTLKFLGDTDEEFVDKIHNSMKASVEGIEPFTLSVKNMGAFPGLNYMHVVWVGMDGAEPLIQIAKELNTSLKPLGFKSDKKGFTPHLTIARVRSPKNKSELRRAIDAHIESTFGEIDVDRIILKKSVLSSRGPTYSDVREVEFRGSN